MDNFLPRWQPNSKQPNIDAFGRLRVSNPYTLFDSQNRYAPSAKFFSNVVGLTSNVGYILDESTVTLNCGGANESVTRQSKHTFSYQPGKSLLVLCTFVMDEPKSNLIQRVGYFDDLNGVFVEQNGTTKSIVIRNAGVESERAEINVDLTKIQIFFMDIEWLGSGTVRTGFVIDGEYKIMQSFHHANRVSSVYMTTANLPVRYQILGARGTLKQVCSTVISEGGYEPALPISVIHRDVVTVTDANVITPLISLRLRSDRLGAIVNIKQLDILVTSKDSGTWYLLLNPVINTPSWQTSNLIEYDISSSNISSIGKTLNSGFYSGSANIPFDIQQDAVRIGLTDINKSDVITLAVSSFSVNSTMVSKIGWNEI